MLKPLVTSSLHPRTRGPAADRRHRRPPRTVRANERPAIRGGRGLAYTRRRPRGRVTGCDRPGAAERRLLMAGWSFTREIPGKVTKKGSPTTWDSMTPDPRARGRPTHLGRSHALSAVIPPACAEAGGGNDEDRRGCPQAFPERTIRLRTVDRQCGWDARVRQNVPFPERIRVFKLRFRDSFRLRSHTQPFQPKRNSYLAL